MIDLGICVEIPRDAQEARGALIRAREGALHSQRLKFVWHALTFVVLSLANCLSYLIKALAGTIQIGVLQLFFSNLGGAANYFLEQGTASVQSLICMVVGLRLLARTLIEGVEIASRHIQVQPEQSLQAESLREEWEQMDIDEDLPNQFRFWLHELLTTLPRELLSHLAPLSPPEAPPHLLRERLLAWLQYQLPNRLQNMILSIRRDSTIRELYPQEGPRHEALLQDCLQKLLRKRLQDRLLRLFQDWSSRELLQSLLQQQLQDLIQSSLQSQLQEELQVQLSYLSQDLSRAVRQKLQEEALQDQLQSLIRNQHQDFHSSPFRQMLQALRQELLESRGNTLCPLNFPETTKTLFHDRFLELLEIGGATSSSLSPVMDIGQLGHLRQDLVVDIVLDLFADHLLKPLQELSQNESQDSFLENNLPNLHATLRRALFQFIRPDGARNPEQLLPRLFDDLCQGLVDSAGLSSSMGRDQARAYPVQIGPLQVGLEHEEWNRYWYPLGFRGMFRLWFQRLLVNLSRRLIANLSPRSPSSHISETPTPFTDRLQGSTRELLQRHLLRHLQNMVLSILRDNKTIQVRGSESVLERISAPEEGWYTRGQRIQRLIQASLSEILQDWLSEPPLGPLLILLQDPRRQGLDIALLQNDFQRQIQDRLPNLHQNLFRTVRQKLFHTLPEEREADAIQNRFQDHIQSRFQSRLQNLHLSQLQGVFCALRQELLDRRKPVPKLPEWGVRLVQILVQDEDLLQNLRPTEQVVRVLRPDLVTDLLLYRLLDLLEEILPQCRPDGFQGVLLEERQLPNLYKALHQVLHVGMFSLGYDRREATAQEGVLRPLYNTLIQSFAPAHLPSAPGHIQAQSNRLQDFIQSPTRSQRQEEVLQDQLQNLIRNQRQELHLSLFREPLQMLRRELLGEDRSMLCPLNFPDITKTLFHDRFLELLEMGGATSSSLSPVMDIGQLGHLRQDLVVDIVLDLFVDHLLKPLQELSQNESQDSFLENNLPNLHATLRRALFQFIRLDRDCSSEQLLPRLFDDLCQGLVDSAGLSLSMGRDQARAYPIQIGPLQVGLEHEEWKSWSPEYRGMFQLWFQRLLVNLSQRLIVNLSPSPSSHISETPTPFTDRLQGSTRELLRHHLLRHLQNMVLSILRDNKTMQVRDGFSVGERITDLGENKHARGQRIQRLIQDSLSEILQDWLSEPPLGPLLILLQDPCRQGLDIALLQNDFQRQIQDRLPNLHQNLFRTVRQKLFHTLPEEREADAIQSRFQDHIQSRFQSRLQNLHLSQLQGVFCALRQELLDRRRSGPSLSEWGARLVQILVQDEGRSLLADTPAFSGLFQNLRPTEQVVRVLRPDLIADLLLYRLLDFLEAMLSQGRFQGALLGKRQLPNLYKALHQVLHIGMFSLSCDQREVVAQEEVLRTLHNTLIQSFAPAHLPSAPGHIQAQSNRLQDFIQSPTRSQRQEEVLQDQLQNLIRNQRQELHLSLFREPLQMLRRELLGEDRSMLCPLNFPDITKTLFHDRFLELLEMGGATSSSLSPVMDIGQLGHLRQDLVVDIVLDLFVDYLLKPLQELSQNESQDSFLENNLPNLHATLRRALFQFIRKDESHNPEQLLPRLFDDLCQGLVASAGLSSSMGRDQARAYPIQIGPFQARVEHEKWKSWPPGYRGMFQLWFQRLLVNLSQRLIVNLSPSPSSHISETPTPSDRLQGSTIELLRHHLLRHLQNMVLSILRDNKTMQVRGGFSVVERITDLGENKHAKDQCIQRLIQDSLSEILPSWLSELPLEPFFTLLQHPCRQGLDEASLQNDFQRQIQERLPNLRQNLLRIVRKKLFQTLPEARREDAIQNRFQDHIQSRFQSRLPNLHLSQLRDVFCALRQELLDRHSPALWLSEWAARRVQRLIQSEERGRLAGAPILWHRLQYLPRSAHAVNVLRPDLVADLLLDTLLDLLEEMLPQGRPDGFQGPLLEERQLPDLYRALRRVLHESMISRNCSRRERLSQQEALRILRSALTQRPNPANLPSTGG